jgi:tetrahydromethanopterin S-methyltransferase subunit F
VLALLVLALLGTLVGRDLELDIGTQFTCFTYWNKLVLALLVLALLGTLVGRDLELDIGTQFTGFTGTNVQILTDGSGDSACQNHAASSLAAAP